MEGDERTKILVTDEISLKWHRSDGELGHDYDWCDGTLDSERSASKKSPATRDDSFLLWSLRVILAHTRPYEYRVNDSSRCLMAIMKISASGASIRVWKRLQNVVQNLLENYELTAEEAEDVGTN